VCVCSACSSVHLLLCGGWAAVHNVVVDGGLEEARLLADQADLPPQPTQGQLLNVDTIQGDLQVSSIADYIRATTLCCCVALRSHQSWHILDCHIMPMVVQ
jgi:hypothetical protein